MALLPDEAIERLTATCRTTAGDNLRSVTYFTREDFMQVYLRDDLARDADLMGFIGNERQDFSMTHDAYEGSELGDYRYTIRVFENGYLLRVDGEDHGVFVTTDAMEIRDYNALASAIEETLSEWEWEQR
ncbi:DUF7522 family protein [Halobaculum sp. D14]|uniref:DUF7522 family protein n=1 Tax=unclassified Halobaculum TaxID=2640896 RepID=UPI003EBF2625